jgi:2-amino-4-hydroxy-6-hydroxymethyldihydropteridine diphosphokinase
MKTVSTRTPGQPDVAVEVWIGLGANLNDRVSALAAAWNALRQHPDCRVVAHSSLWQSPAFKTDGPDYLNAVIGVQSTLSAHALLQMLQALETRHGRQRPYPGAPRTLDLDLLLYGTARTCSPTLEIPHPRMTERAFVLRPLAEVHPTLIIPGHGSLHNCLTQVADQPCTPWPCPTWPSARFLHT